MKKFLRETARCICQGTALLLSMPGFILAAPFFLLEEILNEDSP